MNGTGRMGMMAVLVSLALTGAAIAQSAQPPQNQQNQQNQSQSQDQTTGVSQPPPDSTIQATEVLPPPDSTPAPTKAKPSAAIPATPSNAASAAPATTTPAAAAQPAVEDPDAGIVTSVPPANEANSAAQPTDPDYGIVTSVPPANAPAIKASGFDPDSDIVNYVPVDPNALGEGTNITVSLSQDLSTTDTTRGTTFRALVTQDVYNGARVVIPAGAEMRGRVTYVSQGHHIGPHATLRLRPDVVVLPDGTAYHLYAEAIASMAPGTRVNDEGGIEASHHYTKDAIEYGAGAGAGAAAGAAVGGPVGAGVGSVVGAGLVTTHMFMQPPQAADLPKGSVLIFSLTEPMPLTPTKN